MLPAQALAVLAGHVSDKLRVMPALGVREPVAVGFEEVQVEADVMADEDRVEVEHALRDARGRDRAGA